MRCHRLHQARPILAGIGPRDQVEQRMRIVLARILMQQERNRADALGDQPHRAVHHRVLGVAFPRQRRIVARRPPRASAALQRDQPRGARGLGFGRRQHGFDEIEHGSSLVLRRSRIASSTTHRVAHHIGIEFEFRIV